MTLFQIIVTVALGSTAILVAWKKVVWPFICTFVAIGETATTILEIGRQFEPNDGQSLHDRIAKIDTNQIAMLRTQENQTEQLAELTTKVDSYLLNRQEGGRRCTDPMGGH
jgi:hypothetical protein